MNPVRWSWPKRIFGIVVLALVLRETGLIDWTFFVSRTEQQNSIVWRASPSIELESYRIELERDPDATVHAASGADGAAAGTILARLTSAEWSGRHWVPLRKSGQLDWKATIDSSEGSSLGSMDGRIEFEVIGSCSARGFRAAVLDQVEQTIRVRIGEQVHDHGLAHR